MHRRTDHFEGFLEPAGLIDGPLRVRPDHGRFYWAGRHPVRAKVRLVVRYPGARRARRTLDVGLAAGWG